MKRMLFLITALLLVSCSSVDSENESVIVKDTNKSSEKIVIRPAPSAPPPPPVVATAPKPAMEPRIIMTRDYLLRNEPSPVIPTNFVYFPHRPVGEKETAEYIRICEIWKAAFPLSKEALAVAVDRNKFTLIPLYWPLVKLPHDESCKNLVDNYDYVNVNFMITGLKKFDMSKRQLVSIHEKAFITLDLSKMSSLEYLTIAFEAWRTEISKRPTDGGTINPYTLVASAKDVLGALSSFITLKKNT